MPDDRKESMILPQGDQRRAATVLHAGNDAGKVVGLDHEDEFLDQIDAAPVVAGSLNASYRAWP